LPSTTREEEEEEKEEGGGGGYTYILLSADSIGTKVIQSAVRMTTPVPLARGKGEYVDMIHTCTVQ